MISETKSPEPLKLPIPKHPENGFSLWDADETPPKDSTENTSIEIPGIGNYVGMKNLRGEI